jgi:3-dehydroquinate synthetase
MQLKEDHWESLYVFAKNLADKNISFSEIEIQLNQQTSDRNLITEIIQQVKKVHYAIKRKNGLVKIGFGALFLLAGFFITCINFYSNQSFTIVMYSSTSLGLLFVFLGLYDVIG